MSPQASNPPATEPGNRTGRPLFLFFSALLIALCLWAGHFGLIGGHPLFGIPTGQFMALHALTFLAGVRVMLTLPNGLSRRQTALALILLAAACRICLLPHPPSDDINRYLWEGRMIREGVDPYRLAPDAPELARFAENDPYRAAVNHPDVPAIYPPGVLRIFALLGNASYTPLAIKLAVLGADLAAVALLLLLLADRGAALRWAAIYAFNPVTLFAFAGQGHLDAFQNAALLLALVLHARKRWVLMFLALGAAVQIKYVAIVAAPFFINRENLKWAWAGALAILAPFFPYLHVQGPSMFQGLLRFGGDFAFNGPVHALLRHFFDNDIRAATGVCRRAFIMAFAFGLLGFHPWLRRRFSGDPAIGVFFTLSALLLLSPTVHIWYLAWVFPFVALMPSASWLLLGLTSAAYYAATGILHETGIYRLPEVYQIVEWAPFWVFLVLEARLAVIRASSPLPEPLPETVSVIIPTKNEAENIGSCVTAALSDPAVSEVLVVDAGSGDGTARIAQEAGAAVLLHDAPVENGGGRGGQILAGLKAAAGDVAAVVHADVRVPPPGFSRMLILLQKQPLTVGGALGGEFEGPGLRLRALEVANDLKAAFFGISFGDQVQFFRRRAVLDSGAFAPYPLMEDVELSLRMRRLGRTAYLFGPARISSRSWRKKGASGHFFRIIKLLFTFLMVRTFKTPDTLAMFRAYYNGSKD